MRKMAINNKLMQSKMFSKQLWNYAIKQTRYPWFDEEDIKKLENMTKDITNADEREDTMDQLYRWFYDTVQNEHKLKERSKLLNQQAYEVWNITDPEQKKQAQTKLKLSELAQQIKKTYNVSANANDWEVLNLFIDQTPNWQKLLENYLNDWDKTLLYVWWLEKESEEVEVEENTWATDTTQWWIYGVINNSTWNRWKAEWLNPVWEIANYLIIFIFSANIYIIFSFIAVFF